MLTIATLTFLFWYFIGTHPWPEILTSGQWAMGNGHMAHHLLTSSPSPSPSPSLILISHTSALLTSASQPQAGDRGPCCCLSLCSRIGNPNRNSGRLWYWGRAGTVNPRWRRTGKHPPPGHHCSRQNRDGDDRSACCNGLYSYRGQESGVWGLGSGR